MATTRRSNSRSQTSPAKGRMRRTQSAASGTNKGIIRYAVVGLGYISQAAMLPAFKHAKRNSKLTALVSSSPKKLKTLGRKYGVKNLCSYEQYDDLLRSGEVDAVYIALPNSMHAEYSIRAANAGVHVLCEKPMAVTEDECLQMLQAAQSNNVKLMIAYRLHFEAANLTAIDICESGKIGDLRLFNSIFAFNIKDDNIRIKRELGGGTVYDIGIYCINAARYLFRAEPTEVVAFTASRAGDPRFEDVDEITGALMRFPDDRIATFMSSFNAVDVSSYRVMGTKGELRVEPAYDLAADLHHYLTIKGKTKHRKFPKRDQFAPLLLHFSECILTGKNPEPSGEEGLIDVRIIEAIYHSADIGQPVSLNVFPPDSRPSMMYEMKKPPVREPAMVQADSPQ